MHYSGAGESSGYTCTDKNICHDDVDDYDGVDLLDQLEALQLGVVRIVVRIDVARLEIYRNLYGLTAMRFVLPQFSLVNRFFWLYRILFLLYYNFL